MLRKLVNEAEVELVLSPLEPLLVAAGIPNDVGIDMPFVVTHRRGDRAEPYLPGSSLKGMLRSHAERISRALAPATNVCDPHFRERNPDPRDPRVVSCGHRLEMAKRPGEAEHPSHRLYASSCPICRTFGSTVYRSRLSIGDAYLCSEGFGLERRDGVGIDRFSGGAARGIKFELEVLTRGEFKTRLRLENFEDWQVGLLALLCRDLEDGLLSIGHSTTRGLGRLGARITKFETRYTVPPSRSMPRDQVLGVGALLEPDEGARYGYIPQDHFTLTKPVELERRQVVRQVQSFADDAVRRQFFDDAVARWAERMEGWQGRAS